MAENAARGGARPARETFGIGRFSGRQLIILWAVLSAGMLLRIIALDWGLPPSGPERAAAALRSSYAMDEDDILDALARTDPGRLDFAAALDGTGTLQAGLTLAALEAAEAAGAFGEPWREAWRGMQPGGFERVYVVGRAVSVAADLGAALLAALIALRLVGVGAALWAAALVALSPGHILQAGQIRADATVTACLLLLCLTVLARRGPLLTGLVAGLAAAAKLSIAPLAVAAVAAAVAYGGWAPKRLARAGAGAGIGLLAGAPGLLLHGLGFLHPASPAIPPVALLSAPVLVGKSLLDLARFSIGVPAAALAVAGLVLLWRRGGLDGRLLPIVFGAGLLALALQHWPLMRYHLPLAPVAAIAAAVALNAAGRWSRALGAAALFVAGSASFAVVAYRLAPHPANLALQLLERAAEPGQSVSRILPELPPLAFARYPPGPNPLTGDLRAGPPDWVVTSDLPLVAYPEDNQRFLRERYEPIAVFRVRGRYSWATLGERGAPQDWKYSHPRMTIYRRR